MRPERFHPEDLVRLFRKERIATMAQLKDALGTLADATIFRKLRALPSLTSYSHSGRYYTLEEIAEFDELGLWSCRSVRFSRHGTLLSTAAAFVESAEAGWYANELEAVLEVPVKEALLQLHRRDRISRERIGGRYLYCSAKAALFRKQRRARRSEDVEVGLGVLPSRPRTMTDELKAAIVLFLSSLDEKQRRLYAGLESLKLGHGGDRRVAEILGLDASTIARGRRQLEEHDVEVDRVRRAGGGRKRLEKKHQKRSHGSKS
jgi:hypothetical protein